MINSKNKCWPLSAMQWDGLSLPFLRHISTRLVAISSTGSGSALYFGGGPSSTGWLSGSFKFPEYILSNVGWVDRCQLRQMSSGIWRFIKERSFDSWVKVVALEWLERIVIKLLLNICCVWRTSSIVNQGVWSSMIITTISNNNKNCYAIFCVVNSNILKAKF